MTGKTFDPVTDRVFAIEGDWAVGADELQWILYRRRTRRSGPYWQAISFVRSSRDVLARCMREKGLEPGTAAQLLATLQRRIQESAR
jgi:hypothetical protein